MSMTSYCVVFGDGVGYRNSTNYEDRKPGQGPNFGDVVQVIMLLYMVALLAGGLVHLCS